MLPPDFCRIMKKSTMIIFEKVELEYYQVSMFLFPGFQFYNLYNAISQEPIFFWLNFSCLCQSPCVID